MGANYSPPVKGVREMTSNYKHTSNAPQPLMLDMETITTTAATTITLLHGGIVLMNNAADQTITLDSSSIHVGEVWVFICQNTGTATTVTLPLGVTWNGSHRVASFQDDEVLVGVFETDTRFRVLINIGTVAFS